MMARIPVANGLARLANCRIPPPQAVQAAIAGAQAADAAHQAAREAREHEHIVNQGMAGIHEARRQLKGRRIPRRRDFKEITTDHDDPTIFGNWRPHKAQSFNEIRYSLKDKSERGLIDRSLYQRVNKVIENAIKGDDKSLLALAKGFHAGTGGLPVSYPWYCICFILACQKRNITFGENEATLPADIKSISALEWPATADVDEFDNTGIHQLNLKLMAYTRSVIRPGCWMLEMHNQGLAPAYYKTVLLPDQQGEQLMEGIIYAGEGNGMLNSMVRNDISKLAGSLNPAQVAFAQHLRDLMKIPFEGQWNYVPGEGRKFEMSILTTVGGQADAWNFYDFQIIGIKPMQNSQGYVLQAQEKETGEWFLHYMPEADNDPRKFVTTKPDVKAIKTGLEDTLSKLAKTGLILLALFFLISILAWPLMMWLAAEFFRLLISIPTGYR